MPREEGTIAGAVQDCLETFALAERVDRKTKSYVVTQRDRLSTWAKDTGFHHPSQTSSLDNKLRDDAETRRQVIFLLRHLAEVLKDYWDTDDQGTPRRKNLSGEYDDYDIDGEHYDTARKLRSILDGCESTIDQLVTLDLNGSGEATSSQESIQSPCRRPDHDANADSSSEDSE